MKTIGRGRKILYLILGILMTGLGFLGIITPILPTTVFLIAASWFFIHSSPRLHRWLNGNRVTGPYLRVYTEKQGLSRKRKAGMIAFLWTGLLVSAWFVQDRPWLWLLLAVVGIAVTLHLITIRPEKPLVPAQEVEHKDLDLGQEEPEKVTERIQG